MYSGNGKWTAFIQRFSNQWPLSVLFNIALHSPIHAHIHTPTAVAAMQGDSARRSWGSKLATFRSPANPLYLLSHMPPQGTIQDVEDVSFPMKLSQLTSILFFFVHDHLETIQTPGPDGSHL